MNNDNLVILTFFATLLILVGIITFICFFKPLSKVSIFLINRYYKCLYYIYFGIAKFKRFLLKYKMPVLFFLIGLVLLKYSWILIFIKKSLFFINFYILNEIFLLNLTKVEQFISHNLIALGTIAGLVWAYIKFWEEQRFKLNKNIEESFLALTKKIDENNIEAKCCAIKALNSFVKYNEINTNKKYLDEKDFIDQFYKQNACAKNSINLIFTILINNTDKTVKRICKETLGELNHEYDNLNNKIKLKTTRRSNAVYKSTVYKEIENKKENELRETSNYKENLMSLKVAFLPLYRKWFFINDYYVSPIQIHNKDLSEAKDLGEINLRGAGFISSNLQGLNFCKCLLEDARLRSSDLTNANFERAILTNAEFFDAILNKTNFKDAVLINICLRRIEKLANSNFEGAIIDYITFTEFFNNNNPKFYKDVKKPNGETKYKFRAFETIEEIEKMKYSFWIETYIKEYWKTAKKNLGRMVSNEDWGNNRYNY